MRKFEGVEVANEVSPGRLVEDLRSPTRRLRDWWITPDGQQNTFLILVALALVLVWAPLAGEFILLLMLVFGKVLLNYKKRKWDFPFRMPVVADLIDGSTNRPGQGLMYLGTEVGSRLPTYISDNDARTHALLFGTTGSGKTELLLAFVVNALIYDGGASYTDGKGDVKLWLKFLNAARMFGREDDLLLISFITSGQEFYDRQETKISNTMNPYANGSSAMCTEASISLMDGGKGDDMWKGRAIAFLGAVIKPLVFLRDKGEILLDSDGIREYFDLPVLERFVWDEEDTWKSGVKREQGYFAKKYGKVWDRVIRPLQAFMVTIPGYDKAKLGRQEQKTLEQHGYITMQLARLFGELADNYGHIMQTPLGEVDMYDVVINDRILVTLLPALEKSPESLGMLGKIIVGGIKQMAAGCLGNRVEGLRREIVDARPTNSPVPFPTIFDEYGYYAVLGFSSMPAQARSLGFMVVFAAQDFASLKKSSPEEADQTWENTNLRGIGRITSGGDAETYKRMSALGGTVKVAELSGFERVFGMFRTRIRASERIDIKDVPRVNSDDLHSQNDGEFHLFLGKKEDEAKKGRVRVARVNAFYTDIKPAGKPDKNEQPPIAYLTINHFARVTPPALVVDPRADPGLYGEKGFAQAFKHNLVAPVVKANESRSAMYATLRRLTELNAGLPKEQQFVQRDLTLAFLAYLPLHDQFKEKEMNTILAHVGISKPRQEGIAGIKSTSSGSGGGPSEEHDLAPALAGAQSDVPPSLMKPRTVDEVDRPSAAAPVTAAPPKDQPLFPKSPTADPNRNTQLTEADRSALQKATVFSAGATKMPVNTATKEQLTDLAEAMRGSGAEVPGGALAIEKAVEKAMDSGALDLEVKGLDPKSVTDTIVETTPSATTPEGAVIARAEGQKYVEKMALGSTYLQAPVPPAHTISAGSFLEAVEALNEAAIRQLPGE